MSDQNPAPNAVPEQVPAPAEQAAAPEVQPQRRRFNPNWRNIFRWIVGILLLAILVLGVIFLLQKVLAPRTTVDGANNTSSGASVVAAPAYVCNAVQVGAPVSADGKCSFCTINYSKPGSVFVVGETPMEYTKGAWVFQYNSGSIDGFKACINGQSFVSDPSYQTIWK